MLTRHYTRVGALENAQTDVDGNGTTARLKMEEKAVPVKQSAA